MGKRNKIRYQRHEKNQPVIQLTGNVWLQHYHDDEITQAQKGDLMLFPSCDALHNERLGDYESRGLAGYFKVDVADGKTWQAVLLTDIFPNREHHFSKTEQPFDTYQLCADILSSLKGRTLKRTYREHYELQEKEEGTDDDA